MHQASRIAVGADGHPWTAAHLTWREAAQALQLARQVRLVRVARQVRNLEASRKLFVETLGLPLAGSPGDDYIHSENIGGSKHFGVWPLHQAVEACFGTAEWPADRPVPQASVEFEVASESAVELAARELEARDTSFSTARAPSRGGKPSRAC